MESQIKKHINVINIVRQMVHMNPFKQTHKIINKVKREYYKKNTPRYSKSLECICDAFEILNDPNKTENLLKNSFMKNCRLTNVVSTVLLNNNINNVMLEKERKVHLVVYLYNDIYLCYECHKMWGGYINLDTECVVTQEEAFIFSCTFFCKCCFVNKLYT
ncbi:hypothetical protein [Diatraea saccharalis granulovirus]|uniref:Uncharacterized protein n=1 Tax=Diatraea saccharalis granulovirus TaxID=1675862 RepID=A0A0R7EYU1_9BBAC|nr:hypothetical protein [Diatraea saccharalis granulovirus]AKN80753.1 hypothetical protein [Diatraea saccharalis granulovirus]